MTKEEAIKYLQQLYPNGGFGYCWLDEQRIEAIGMAVKSLQEEPVSEDLEVAARRYAKEEYSRKSPAALPDRCRACYAPIMYAFQGGAEWQREQMVKDAVIIEDELVMCYNNGEPTGLSPYKEWWDAPEVQSRFTDGDKVKVIIIKE